MQWKEIMDSILLALKNSRDPHLIVHQQALKCCGILILRMQLPPPSPDLHCKNKKYRNNTKMSNNSASIRMKMNLPITMIQKKYIPEIEQTCAHLEWAKKKSYNSSHNSIQKLQYYVSQTVSLSHSLSLSREKDEEKIESNSVALSVCS